MNTPPGSRRSLLLLVLGLMFATPALHSEIVYNKRRFVPENYDLEGTWRYPRPAAPVQNVFTRVLPGYAPFPADSPVYGHDWFTLKKTGFETDPGSGNYRYLTFKYQGNFYHRHGLGRRCVEKGSEGLLTFTYDYRCGFEDMVFDLAGRLTLTIDRRDEQIIGFKVTLVGTTTNQYSLPHTRHFLYDNDDLSTSFYATVFQDPLGNFLQLGNMNPQDGFTSNPNFSNLDCKTLDCNIFVPEPDGLFAWVADNVFYDDSRGLYNKPTLDLQPVFWERNGGASPRSETGTIKGRLIDRANSIAIRRANIYLNEQAEPVRPKGINQSQQAYDIYIHNVTRRLVRANLQADGSFEFSDVPLFRRVEGTASRWETAAYTIEVTDAEGNVDFLPGTQVIRYRDKMIHNIPPREESVAPVVIGLDAISSIAAKRDVATQLSNLSTNNYRLIETNVLEYLRRLETGELALTLENEEAVKRAFWAEAMVREGSSQARELIEIMLKGLGSTITDLLGMIANNDSARGEQGKKLVNSYLKTVVQPDQFKEMSVDPNLTPEDISRLANDGVSFIALDTVDKVAGLGATTVEALMIQAGAPKTKAVSLSKNLSTAAKLTTLALKGLLGLDKAAFFRNVRDEVIKEVINQMAPLLYDNQLPDLIIPFAGESIPLGTIEAVPSYCKLTAPYLEYSHQKTREWRTDDDPKYRADATTAAYHLQQLITEGTDVKKATIYLQATAKIGKSAGTVLGLAGTFGLSQAKIAAEISKKVAQFANVSLFVVPAVYVFYQSPNTVEKGVYAAFGEKPPASVSGQSVSTSGQPFPPMLKSRFDTDYLAFTNAAVRVETALAANRLGEAITNMLGSQGFDLSFSLFRDSAACLATAASGVQNSPDGALDAGTLLQRQTAWTLASGAAHHALVEMLTRFYAGEYSGTNDPVFLTDRNSAAEAFAESRRNAQSLASAAGKFVATHGANGFKPAIEARVLALVSKATGRPVLSTNGENFELRVRVANLSSQAISNLTASVSILPADAASALESATISINALGPIDSIAGGPDEAELRWTIRFDGSPTNTGVLHLTVDLLENGNAPESFVAAPASAMLLPDPAVIDPDRDGLPSAYEIENGLNPALADGAADLDNDGLTNLEEFLAGTDPRKADTDGDGVSDGDEVHPPSGRYATDPLVADTDADGTFDAEDGEPLNPLSVAALPANEPVVALTTNAVTLSRANPIVRVRVDNARSGTLYWDAELDPPGIVAISPHRPSSAAQGTELAIALADPGTPDLIRTSRAVVRVTDTAGAIADAQEIVVNVQGDPPPVNPVVRPKINGITVRTGNRIRVTFEGDGGKSLRLEQSSDLKTWTEAYRADDYTGGPVALTLNISPGARFYRARQ